MNPTPLAVDKTKLDHGFTLIELLITVAIIGILAAIAVPNFLEAQTRSKVSRARGDLRTYAVALEAYRIDRSAYPYPRTTVTRGKEHIRNIFELSTPIAYIPSVDGEDPFKPDWTVFDPQAEPLEWMPSIQYLNFGGFYGEAIHKSFPNQMPALFPGYCLYSVGPDRTPNGIQMVPQLYGLNRHTEYVDSIYDPTNGTISGGDIGEWTGRPSVFGAF